MICYSRNNHYCIMNKLILASHNSFTYLKPKRWYMKPFNFMSKCQSKGIREQYNDYNVRLFDLRVAFDKHLNPYIRHGIMNYGYKDVEASLSFLNSRNDTIYVRVILENNSREYNDKQSTSFYNYCKYLQDKYPNIKFLDGVRKFDWVRLYDFGNNYPSMDADFSSVKGSKIDDLWPWLYAKKHNKKAIENCKSKYLMIDFVEIQ